MLHFLCGLISIGLLPHIVLTQKLNNTKGGHFLNPPVFSLRGGEAHDEPFYPTIHIKQVGESNHSFCTLTCFCIIQSIHLMQRGENPHDEMMPT
jgi:hypothetical protein